MLTVYGIKNCDTVKRARQSLEGAGIEHRFHDFRVDGLDEATAAHFLKLLGHEAVINRRGTSWRKLDAGQQAACAGSDAARVLLEVPALIKRPVFDKDGELRVGFARKDEAEILHWLRA